MDFENFEDDELEALKKEQAGAANKKAWLGAIGAVADNFQSIPGSHELLWGGKGRAPTASKVLGAAAQSISDPMEQKQKAFEYLKAKRAEAQAQAANQPASAEMVSFYESIVPSMKGKFGGFSEAQLEKVSPVLMAKFRAEGDERMAKMMAGQRSADKADALKKEQGEKEARLTVPGYARTGEVLPKDEEAMKFRKAVNISDQLKKKIARMKELVKSHGSFEYGGQGGQEMETLATEIQLLGKSPELYELGVLTGPDLTLLQKITADPTSVSSLFTRDSTRQKQLDTQLSSIDQKLESTAKALGYQAQGAPKDPEVEAYAAKHGVTYEQALAVKASRTANIGKR